MGGGAAHAQAAHRHRHVSLNGVSSLVVAPMPMSTHLEKSLLHRANRQANIGWLQERLVVSTGISHLGKVQLPEDSVDLVREVSGSEAASNRGGSGGSSKLQDRRLASAPGG